MVGMPATILSTGTTKEIPMPAAPARSRTRPSSRTTTSRRPVTRARATTGTPAARLRSLGVRAEVVASPSRDRVVTLPPGTIPRRRFGDDFDAAFKVRPEVARKLVLDRMTSRTPAHERLESAGELVQFVAAGGSAEQRRTMIAAFAGSGAELAFIHKLSDLPAARVEEFVQDYFDAGGTMEPVLVWLQLAGEAMDKPGARPTTARRSVRATFGFGDIVGAVGGALGAVGNAIGNAVTSLVDAVVKAGKSLGQMVNDAVHFTLKQLKDLVSALLRAGKRVADILAAAEAKSLDQLRKYVEAIIAAGRSVAEVMSWAVGQVLATANAVVAKLIALGRSVGEIVKSVLAVGRAALMAAVRGVLAAGRKVLDILTAIAADALSVVKPIVDALLGVGRAVSELLVEGAKLIKAAFQRIVQALLELGQALQSLLVAAANAVAGTLLKVVEALLTLGRGLGELLGAVALAAAAVVKAVVEVLIQLGRKLADIVLSIVTLAANAVRAILSAILALGYKVIDILFTVAGRALSAIRTVLEALLAMGVSLGNLLVDICEGIAQAFRRGFFEGLVALGKAPLQILKAAFEVKASLVLLAFAVLMEMFGGYRALTPDERREAEFIFGASINLDRVQVGFAAIPFQVIDYLNIEIPRAFTTMYLLNFGPGAKVDVQTIIHELAHVWQGVQEGPLYMTRALEAQIGAGVKSLFHHGHYDDSKAYEVTEAELRANGNDLSKFNPEEQAIIAEYYWIDRRTTGRSGLPVDLLEPYARKMFRPIRASTARGGRVTARHGARPVKRLRTA